MYAELGKSEQLPEIRKKILLATFLAPVIMYLHIELAISAMEHHKKKKKSLPLSLV